MKKKVLLSAGIATTAVLASGTIVYAKVGANAMDFDFYDPTRFLVSQWANGGDFDCTWTADNLALEDSTLIITIDKDETGYTSGEVSTRQSYSYGYYETRMKPIKNDGVVTSFFTYEVGEGEDGFDEIDIEFLGYDTTKVQFNYYTDGVGHHEYLYDLGFDASEEYHTYGFNWYEGGITWYVDGVEVYTAVGDVPDEASRICVNAWPGKNLDSWIGTYDGTTGLKAYYDWISYGDVKTE